MARLKKKSPRQTIISTLKIVAVFGFAGLLGVGFFWAERYVKTRREVQIGTLVFTHTPPWVDQALLAKVTAAAGGDRFYLEPGVARDIGVALKGMAWLSDVTVEVGPDAILVHAEWRKPLATVKNGLVHFCVDRDLVVLDQLDLSLPLVTIRGVRYRHKPSVGTRLEEEDLAAAVELISILDSMDAQQSSGRRLLADIDTLDISNFRGREAKQASHITLTTKGRTRIEWGAEIGAWGEHLENSDRVKLARLYTVFKELDYSFDTLKRINVKDSRQEVPLPADQL